MVVWASGIVLQAKDILLATKLSADCMVEFFLECSKATATAATVEISSPSQFYQK